MSIEPRGRRPAGAARPPERISRAELALALERAAELDARASEDSLPIEEGERIAEEVGIDPAAFRAAVAEVRSAQASSDGLLGPEGTISAEDDCDGRVTAEEARRILGEAQLSVRSVGAQIVEASEGLWRLSDGRRVLVQVASAGGRTRVSAAVDLNRTRQGLLGASTVAGAVAGLVTLPSAALVLLGTPEALVAANAVGLLGGGLAGLAGGRWAWTAMARRTRERVLATVERMRQRVAEVRGGDA